jgi:hypothetical protein
MIERSSPAVAEDAPVEREQHRLLARAIEANPDAPVNYLLRGEEWLMCGQLARAWADFTAARARAENLLSQSAWGYIYQAYIDRADAGLRQCGSVSDRFSSIS